MQNESNLPQPLARTLGAIMGGAGIMGAIAAWNHYPGFPDYSKNIDALMAGQENAANASDNAMASAWANFAQNQRANVEKGLAAQNITDPAVRARTMQQMEGTLSGAYAQAKAALDAARAKAGNQLSAGAAQYYQNMAQKQYQAAFGKYAAQSGIWGALGGVGAAALMAQNKPPAQESGYDNMLEPGMGVLQRLANAENPFQLTANEPLDYGRPTNG